MLKGCVKPSRGAGTSPGCQDSHGSSGQTPASAIGRDGVRHHDRGHLYKAGWLDPALIVDPGISLVSHLVCVCMVKQGREVFENRIVRSFLSY